MIQTEMLPTTDCGSFRFAWGEKTYVMGILNLTPDSFSDGGCYNRSEAAIRRACQMAAEGADIIDIGAESTRPEAVPVQPAEEAERLFPVLGEIIRECGVPVSVDTSKAVIAAAAVAAGAHLINDVTGLKGDRAMAGIVARAGLPVVLMHNRAKAVYTDLMGEIISDLRESIAIARAAGIASEKIIVDPGIGFGKTTEHNLTVLRELRRLSCLEKPVLLGTSRKSFIGNVLGLPVGQRLEGTAATVALGIAQGADLIRVHDVAEMVRVARMADAVVRR
ncbi:MAG: dihydropteroate synthase [bacterium]|jgi:dihydropteroate synthase